jgi:hypothetical protein
MKDKVISVLLYPFENNLVAKVTRSTGHFDFPQRSHTYIISYDSKMLSSFAYWTSLLMMMHNKYMILELAKNYLNKKGIK